MRLLTFTLLAIAVASGIHWGLEQLPYHGPGAMKVITGFSHLFLPMIATAGLAYVMRVSSIGYVIALAIFSPFVSWVLMFFIAVFVFNEQAYI